MHLATFIYTYTKASKKYIYNNIYTLAISELVTLVRLKKKYKYGQGRCGVVDAELSLPEPSL